MDLEIFSELLLDAANGALPYIGVAVGGGLVIFAVFLGIRSALRVFRNITYERSGDAAYDDALWAEDQKKLRDLGV